ncbi:hypothetical protein LOAG_07512 [Loa loa]|uniref:Uncharacterized protein n=1 Tax=Loa loa TaxID=7209 RepID=A0A1S0TVR1_LOALO|nr:hypothetical protein LOAG_07512 [Loa loa]EFO20979.2 hypothetical protein LOAG_07512 [Loa loa]
MMKQEGKREEDEDGGEEEKEKEEEDEEKNFYYLLGDILNNSLEKENVSLPPPLNITKSYQNFNIC